MISVFIGWLTGGLIAVAIMSASTWGPEAWKKFGPGAQSRRNKLALNDALLDGLTAHICARPDLWNVGKHEAMCAPLKATAWIANEDYAFKLSVGASNYVAADFSKAAKWRFLNGAKGRSHDQTIARVRDLLLKVEKSINENGDNVVALRAKA